MEKENHQFRIEKDFLGSKEVPVDAYYGVQSIRANENFPITGRTIDKNLIEALAIVKKSAAQGYCTPKVRVKNTFGVILYGKI